MHRCFLLLSAGVVALGSVMSGAAEPAVELFRDDFSRYRPGPLTAPLGQLNGAIQEYHYLAHRGTPLGPWANAICYMDCWAAGEEDGKPYLEQHFPPTHRRMDPKLFSPIFLTGQPEWGDYTVEVSVRPLSSTQMAGLVFRYHTNRHHYLFCLQNGKQARLALRLPLEKALRTADWKELATADFPYDDTRYYRLKVETRGDKVRAFVDDKLVLSAESADLPFGKVGITATSPARFQDFRVTASAETKRAIDERIHRRTDEEVRLRTTNPRPKLWKKFETPRFGAGRNVRFGDLDGDGVPDMLIAQNVAKVEGDTACEISCLTAVTLDGKVLWQIGKPDPRNGLLTCDTPFQVHDLEGSGRCDVVLVKDFKLQVLDGKTGKLKRWAWMPKIKDYPKVPQTPPKAWPYERDSGDSIVFVNFSGKKGRTEVVVKDRYWNFWVFDKELKHLWSGQGSLGHYPYPFAGGADGRDLLAIGYSLWDGTGKQLWSLDQELKDHADSVAVGNFSGDPKEKPMHYYSCSDEGFVMIDHRGVMQRHHRIGHAQTATVGKFRPELPGLQYVAINFWKNPGIVTLLDHTGKILQQEEPIHSGSPLLPVNWRGDGQEFVLLSGNIREGGMIDGHLRRVVMFPDDGHPDLCAAVMDLTGDARDEIVLWDQDRVWIYTQDRPFEGKKIYAPVRNPDYNESNYRCNVSLPGWKDK
jgi:rhamnogalacturonan endolyase